MTTVSVLLTCHERVERTLACLTRLEAQQLPSEVHLRTFLVDAASADGTAQAVRTRFPEVTVIERGADLFWNGGMRVAMAAAYNEDPDAYLWLNDDVELDADAIERLLAAWSDRATAGTPATIVVGSTRDPRSGVTTYGGVVRPDPRRRPLRFDLVEPGDTAAPVDTMNGNCVLIPRDVVTRIGSLAAAYTHGMGDFDFGLRARLAGGEVWVAPGTVATCSRNAAPARAGDLASLKRQLTSPTGGLPPAEWRTFAQRWGGPLWPLFAASPYVRAMADLLARRAASLTGTGRRR